jgi:predicted amidohydrolase
MRIGYYQYRPRFGEPARNCARVIERLSDVTADVVVLPELAFTGYLFRNRRELQGLAEDPRRSETVERLVALCRERGFHLVAGFAEKHNERCYNSALLVGPRGLRATYRKIHLFNDEKLWFDPGDRPPVVARVRGVRIGLMVCFDWVFPEVARALGLNGAEVVCHPSNLVLDYCQRVMVARCIENRFFAVTANRFGEDRRPHARLRFTGKSQVVDPRGEILHRAASQREQLQIVTIDPRQARDKKITPRNHVFKDRRPDLYR